MSRLKDESLKRCFSLLREFIEGTPRDNQKVAILALNQLQRITAGNNENPDPACIDTPLADGTQSGGESSTHCIDTPLADGTPGGGESSTQCIDTPLADGTPPPEKP